jgi:D-glycero-alpha-D-manno-heptose-7-phosphate kinase
LTTALTPLRLPLAGGLTDVKDYAGRFGGATVSSTIDLGVRVSVTPSTTGAYEITSVFGLESAGSRDAIRNELIREALLSVGHDGPPLAVTVEVDVVDHSGLGTSGAITVALLHALRAWRGERPDAAALAREAAHIEVEVMGGASGYHDANVCARGGLLLVEYRGADVDVHELALPPGFRERLRDSLLLFATGRKASTKASLQRLSAGMEAALPVLHDIKRLAYTTADVLRSGDLAGVATCVAEQQRLKQLLPGSFVDDFVIDIGARVAATGAVAQFPGGKIGGYVLVCCPDAQQAEVRRTLSELAEVRVGLSDQGSRLV